MEYVAWPVATALVAIVAIWFLRAPLTRFIDRAKKISAGGIESAPPSQQVPADFKKSETSELFKLFENEVVWTQAAAVRNDLDARGISEPGHREEALIRSLAATQIARSFDAAYYLIWGSQLALLQHLNPFGETGVAEAPARPLYDAVAAAHPDVYGESSFEEWLGFLVSSGLIARSPGHIKITVFGREFLRYLLEVGRRMDKNL